MGAKHNRNPAKGLAVGRSGDRPDVFKSPDSSGGRWTAGCRGFRHGRLGTAGWSHRGGHRGWRGGRGHAASASGAAGSEGGRPSGEGVPRGEGVPPSMRRQARPPCKHAARVPARLAARRRAGRPPPEGARHCTGQGETLPANAPHCPGTRRAPCTCPAQALVQVPGGGRPALHAPSGASSLQHAASARAPDGTARLRRDGGRGALPRGTTRQPAS